ncbi:RNase H domain-containing protein [Trichonephila clavipes]|nr:RNase H domain-containing protein [Trichonephila clavipes]
MLGRRIAARQPPPTCLPELRRALLDEWCNIPQDEIDNLILSMPGRFVTNLAGAVKLFKVAHGLATSVLSELPSGVPFVKLDVRILVPIQMRSVEKLMHLNLFSGPLSLN